MSTSISLGQDSVDVIMNLPAESSRDLFHNLREHIKIRCIQHCSLFHQDSQFSRDKLVQFWIAEECIDHPAGVSQRLEDVANVYFDALVNEGVILPSFFHNLYGEMIYKVNASIPGIGFQNESDYLKIDGGKSGIEDCMATYSHISFHGHEKIDQRINDVLNRFEQLCTPVINHSRIRVLPSDLFVFLKQLRTLDLSSTYVSDLPDSIGLLESLRLLDLSETPIKQLPESIVRLSFLQTLRLKGCSGIHALPKELRKLTDLCHLDLDIVCQLRSMPKGIGSLLKLQTLRGFVVGKNDGCGIGELRNMNDIRGSFRISRLENVSNVDEAIEAALYKKHIIKLELRWNDTEITDSQIQVEVLENLKPHFGLKELDIVFYNGLHLPNWISDPSFTDLAKITLHGCISCEALSSIGELPSLKFLTIICMNSLRDITSLFYKRAGTDRDFHAFRSFEKLTLDGMLNLETWSGIEEGDFPNLSHVSIRYFPKLSSLPNFSSLRSLQHLEIMYCTQLISLPGGRFPHSLDSLIIRKCPYINLEYGGEDWSKIKHVRKIWIDSVEISLYKSHFSFLDGSY